MTERKSRVVAIVSSYRPDIDLVEHCNALLSQVARVIVVDDGSGAESDELLAKLETNGVEVIRQPENRGVGHAMNVGFHRAQEHGAELVATFDQDSNVPPGFVDALVDEYDRLVQLGVRVGMVAPQFYSSTPQALPSAGELYLDAQAPIQSGTLLPLTVVQNLGPQAEEYFIDLIDTEYAFRARKNGYTIACVPGLSLRHGFGHRLFVHVLGRRLRKKNGDYRMVAVSSPFRYYYRARNRVLFNRAYRANTATRKMLLHQALNDIVLDFSVAVYSSSSPLRMLHILLAGWRDGIRGHTGKMPESVSALAHGLGWRHPVSGD